MNENSNVITPTVGRIIWYFPVGFSPDHDQPNAAIVVHVYDGEDEGHVNLTVFDRNGEPSGRLFVQVLKEGDRLPEDRHCCAWMPYQYEAERKRQMGQAGERQDAGAINQTTQTGGQATKL